MKLCLGCMEMYEDQFDICPYCGYENNAMPEEAFHLTPGTVIGERYIVGKVLGFGGFGVTYIGYDRELEKKLQSKNTYRVSLRQERYIKQRLRYMVEIRRNNLGLV